MANKLAGGIKAGSTGYRHTIRLVTPEGAPVTGKIAANCTASYRRDGALRQAITLSDLGALDAAHSGSNGGGFKEDADGEYRLDLPDAMLAAGVDYVSLHVLTTGAYTFEERIPLETQGAAEVYTYLTMFAATFAEGIASIADPLAKPVPGSYGPGTAGAVLGTLPDVKTVTDHLATAMELSGGVYRFTTAALAQLLQEVVEGTVTVQQALRLANAANGGKVAGGAGTTVTIRDLADAKNRVSATVDQNGNRSAVTLDLS